MTLGPPADQTVAAGRVNGGLRGNSSIKSSLQAFITEDRGYKDIPPRGEVYVRGDDDNFASETVSMNAEPAWITRREFRVKPFAEENGPRKWWMLFPRNKSILSWKALPRQERLVRSLSIGVSRFSKLHNKFSSRYSKT